MNDELLLSSYSAQTTAELVVQTQNLTKTYKGKPVLENLNLAVPKNSIFAFLGPNGAGKSTTIKILLGLIRPTTGRANIFGMDIVHNSVAIRQRIGYLAQEPHFYEHLSARQTLEFVARFFYDGSPRALHNRVNEMLELVGLADKADRPIKGFSGGERQRLGLAQAQINYPDLLILDEPAASLDPQGRRDVLAVMERLREHTTIFYSTHILEDVQRVSDRVAILNHGTLIAEAPIQQLLAGNNPAMIYTLITRGEARRVEARLTGQPWLTNLVARPQTESQTEWEITVNNPAKAENELLRQVLADPSIYVVNFGQKTNRLEDIFLNLVEGSNKSNGN